MHSILTLPEARKIILKSIIAPGVEEVELMAALGRVTAEPLCALHAHPGYDQSTYDGYVIPKVLPQEEEGRLTYALAGEIAAGESRESTIAAGQAFRIMTGGAIPRGGWKVIPLENCQEGDNLVRIAAAMVQSAPFNIQKKGSESALGQPVVGQGMVLTPDRIGRLADAGHFRVPVYRKPRVAYFCTGSELIDSFAPRQRGKKVSSNRYLLDGLIRSSGATADDGGSVADTLTEMCNRLSLLQKEVDADIIISTGGMGPGKYDMLEETFRLMGGRIVFTSLQLRPGKSTLFGILGRSLYFGLPGPPPAVRALFHELVRPALLRAQGFRHFGREAIRAYLEEDLILKKRGVLKLQEGFFSLVKGSCTVRPVWQESTVNCYILCPGHRLRLRRGELLTVHPLQPFPSLFG